MASLLQINVGQAGGQVGALSAQYMGPFTRDGHGCLFIDSEPKVRAAPGGRHTPGPRGRRGRR